MTLSSPNCYFPLIRTFLSTFWVHLDTQAHIPHHKILNLIISEAVTSTQAQNWCKRMPLFLLSKWLGISGTATSRWWLYNIWGTIRLFSKVIIILHSHKQHKMSTHSQQHSIFVNCFHFKHFRELTAYVLIILMCISLMMDDMEHLFHMLIGHLYVFTRKLLTKMFCLFKNFRQ